MPSAAATTPISATHSEWATDDRGDAQDAAFAEATQEAVSTLQAYRNAIDPGDETSDY
jgi:hypothetical protein